MLLNIKIFLTFANDHLKLYIDCGQDIDGKKTSIFYVVFKKDVFRTLLSV